jgi:uncharacterized OB-fold protein
LRPLPSPDAETAPYWDAATGHRLSLQHCAHCDLFTFPPRARCPSCLSSALAWRTVSGRATLNSFCIVHAQLVGGLTPPYVVGLVELVEQPGLLIATNIVGCEEPLFIGMPLEVVFEDLDESTTLPQFSPTRSPGA